MWLSDKYGNLSATPSRERQSFYHAIYEGDDRSLFLQSTQ